MPCDVRGEQLMESRRQMESNGKNLGVLNYWNGERGFGFLRAAVRNFRNELQRVNDRHQPDCFLHVSALIRAGIDPASVTMGDVFTFSAALDKKSGKPKADDVERVGHDDDAATAAARERQPKQ